MKKIVKFIIFALLIGLFIYLGTREYTVKKKRVTDTSKTSDVLLSDGYIFTAINHSKLLTMLTSNDSSFILYACFDDNDLCVSYGNLINEIAKNYEIDEIYYYDFKTDKLNNNATYEKIVDNLSDYLLIDDMGKQDLYAPTLVFIKNGEVYAFDDELAFLKRKIYDNQTSDMSQVKRDYLINTMEGYLSYE